jgi:hypothetical protein
MAQALRQLAPTEKPGTAYTLGPATAGHHCNTCDTDTLIAADLLRINGQGCTSIATFYTCPTCPPTT